MSASLYREADSDDDGEDVVHDGADVGEEEEYEACYAADSDDDEGEMAHLATDSDEDQE